MLARSLRAEAAFWAICALLAGAFASLAVLATREYYLPGDRAVTFALQDLHQHRWAEELFSWANRFGDEWAIALAFVGAVAALAVRRFFAEALLGSAVGLSQLFVAGIDAIVSRPDAEYLAMRATFDGLLYPRIYPSPDGFPSGHVFGEVAVFGFIVWMAPRAFPWWALAWLLRLVCCAVIAAGFAAPMYLGAHWFTDTLAAALLALLALALAWRADRLLHRERELLRIEDLVPARRAAAGAPAVRGRDPSDALTQ
jgi:undecaprenyl-diphosphatase